MADIPHLALGTALWGSQLGEDVAFAIAGHALDHHGIAFFDTAEGYPAPMTRETHGVTEVLFGKWLHTRERGEVVISTKAYGPAGGFRDPEAPLGEAELRTSLEGSMSRLGTDYIDLYLLHWPDHDEGAQVHQASAMGRFIAEGKIKAWGLSNAPHEVFEAYCVAAETACAPEPSIVQNSFSVIADPHRVAEAPVPLMAYGVLGHGLLSGQYRDGVPAASHLHWLKSQGHATGEVPASVEAFHRDCDARGERPIDAALAFAANQPFIRCCCIGVSSVEQLDHVSEAFHRLVTWGS